MMKLDLMIHEWPFYTFKPYFEDISSGVNPTLVLLHG